MREFEQVTLIPEALSIKFLKLITSSEFIAVAIPPELPLKTIVRDVD